VVTVNGNALSMTWGLPASGGAPTGYTLLARVVPGGPIAYSQPLGNVTSFGINAPNGVFYLSVVATNASGPGPESNVVPVTVPSLPPPPGSPTGLVVNVSGNSATFTWVAPTSGGPVANYVLIAGQTPGFVTPLATLVRPATPTGVVVNGVPPGTWYVRIFASNAGGISASTNEVQVAVAGPQPPGTPTLNTPTVVGHTVGLSWSAGPGGAPTSYTLFASATPGGAPFLSVPGLIGTSAGFNNVPSGTYYLRLVANNALGSSPPSNQVALVVP
jgi:titin